MATYLSQTYRLVSAEAVSPNPSDIILEFGETAFSSTDTEVEVYTRLTECLSAIILDVDPTLTNNIEDCLFCDRAITSAAITVSRTTAAKSGLKFSYLFIGRRLPVMV